MFLFTSALFLSGYVLQQQTVRDLQAAIKPKPTPPGARLYLPTQFAVQPTSSPKAKANGDLEGLERETQVLKENESVVEVKESSSDIPADGAEQLDAFVLDDKIGGRRPQNNRRPAFDDPGNLDMVQDQMPMALADDQPLSQPDIPDNAPSISVAEGKPKEENLLSRAERRKKIKEEIMAAGDGEGFKGYKRRQW